MAANMDKGLYEAPLGLDALAADEAPIEIEVVDPEEVRIGIDGMTIEFGKTEPRAEDFDANLAEYMGENELQSLASELLGLIRGKYTQIPAPGSEVTLNGGDLISKGKEQQNSLREKLRQDFEDMSRKAQMERKQSENQSMSSTLNTVPMFIYLG